MSLTQHSFQVNSQLFCKEWTAKWNFQTNKIIDKRFSGGEYRKCMVISQYGGGNIYILVKIWNFIYNKSMKDNKQ